MIYWYPDPTLPQVTFPYSAAQFNEDELYLSRLIEEINSLSEASFEKTDQKRRCDFCRFRTLCERGFIPGMVSEKNSEDQENIFDLDFDDLASVD